MLENIIHDGTYLAFKDTSFQPIFYTTKIISIIFGAIASAYAYKFYRMIHSNILLGISLSFGLMSFTDVFMILILPTINDLDLFNLLFWMRLVTMFLAFTFLGLSYFASSRQERKSKITVKISMLCSIVIILTLLSTWLFNKSNLPEATDYDEYFRAFNVCVMTYVIIMSFKNSIFKQRMEFVYTLVGFSIFLLGQVALTIFSLQGGFDNAITAYVAKDVGLAIFAITLFNASRSPIIKELKHQDGLDAL